MDRTSSNRGLARQLGVSETAVRRAEKAGRIRREQDGSWDPVKVKAGWSDNTDQPQQRPSQAEAPEWQRLYERREDYRIGIVPECAL